MSKQPDNKKRKEKALEKQQQEQAALNKVFAIFLVGIVAECYLLLINNRLVRGDAQQVVTWASIVTWIGYIGVAALAVGAVLAAVKRKTPKLLRLGLWLGGAGLFLAVTSPLFYFFPEEAGYLLVLVPILTVLGLVYYLFQHEFFLTAVILSGSIFTLWVCQKGLGTPNWNTKVIVGSAAVLLGLAAVAALTRQIEKNKGRWIGKRKVRLFSVNCPYPALYLTYGLAFAAIVLSLAVGGAAYYAIWVLGIFFFGMAVYYTTKLM